ncbi:Spy/CpxP family protein refolding chaperone [Kovacikia minuta CCNUW1]|uniref:Spy/CpxP family protein refolding chaperone n=1 Tax=Kovacikia minuta TaxID=2931930 RepID=UPI001CCC9B5F|nr:Spy/CpxP family protein refolding chaperone [Kovacikia minuta]UBF29005.1 Spy/CpxP family protein refolding chaperone [Kovacikia minuta CCNUW1]
MSPRRISAIAAVLIALGGAVAIANQPSLFSQSTVQSPAEQPAQNRDRDKGGWLKDLNLTQDQLKKIQTIRNRYKNQFAQQRQAVQQAQRELRDLMAGDASAEQVRQKYQQLQVLKQQSGSTRFNSMLEIREILTPEQRQKFVSRMKELRIRNKDYFKDHLDK